MCSIFFSFSFLYFSPVLEGLKIEVRRIFYVRIVLSYLFFFFFLGSFKSSFGFLDFMVVFLRGLAWFSTMWFSAWVLSNRVIPTPPPFSVLFPWVFFSGWMDFY